MTGSQPGRVAAARHAALMFAAEVFAGAGQPANVLAAAGLFERWLLAPPAQLVLVRPALTFEQGRPGPGVPTRQITTGGVMGVQMSDTQQVSYAVEPEDSKGVQVSDTLTWASDDNGAVVTVTPSADGLSCEFAAVAPGTANISVTDGTLSGSDQILVTAGPVASLVLTPGTPEDVPPAAPAG